MSMDLPYPDARLLEMLVEGDRLAFETIYRKYWFPLFNAVFKRIKDKQKAEDLVQEVFFKLWRNKEKLSVDNLEAYLRTAARYETINYLSRTKISYQFFEPFHEILQDKDQPDLQLFSKDLLDLIHSFAKTLPEKRRQIFLLHIQSRLSTKEIAEKLGISQKTVQNQLGTALNELKPRILQLVAALITTHYS